jgi:hypothetical protein
MSTTHSDPAFELVGLVQRLSLARSLPEIQEIVRGGARRLTGADGATFVLRDVVGRLRLPARSRR